MDKRIAFVFPGQGAQYPGMMRELYDEYECVRDIFSQASDTLLRDIAELCFNGNEEELNRTENTQVCVLAADLAAAAVARQHGLFPSFEAGFSLGEYAALADSGAIAVSDVFKIVQHRAEAMLRAAPEGCGMAAVIGISPEKAAELCGQIESGFAAPANYNHPKQTTVAGDENGLAEFISLAEAEKIRCQRLSVSVPSHCELMLPASEELKAILQDISITVPKCGLFMNADPSQPLTEDDIRDRLYKQLIQPVQWIEIQQKLQESGAEVFIECGPGRVLCGLARKTVPGVKALNIEDKTSLGNTLQFFAQE